VCEAAPERRVYAAGGQAVSQVAICERPLDDLYIVAGDRQAGSGGGAVLGRAYWNPWGRLVFLGPVLMALGGALSLSDRRLRFAVTARGKAQPTLAPAPAE